MEILGLVVRNSWRRPNNSNRKQLAIEVESSVQNSLLEAATENVLKEKVFLKISQNSQENTSARDCFLKKSQALGL